MMAITIIILFFFGLYVLACITDNMHDKGEWLQIYKKRDTMNRYKVLITCNNIIMTKVFTGDDCSEVLNESINYSLKEADGFPDVILIKKDIIYL